MWKGNSLPDHLFVQDELFPALQRLVWIGFTYKISVKTVYFARGLLTDQH